MIKHRLLRKLRKLHRQYQPVITPLRILFNYTFFQKKIDRNQWEAEKDANWEIYKNLMTWSWEETEKNAPPYFERLKFSVSKARGKVLEVGCGIGTMTRWLAESPEVESIVAIDAFPEAIDELVRYNLPKVTPLTISVENLQLNQPALFDTVVMCEIIEHLYPDEERKFLNGLRSYLHTETKYVISVPIGWMDDPHHVRGFSKRKFKRHLERFYGEPIEIYYLSDYTQEAWGYFKPYNKP